QHSLFTLAQALEAGFTRPRIRRKLASGERLEVERHVYRVALSAPLTWRGRVLTLVLSTGGVASHRSAAALHRLLPPPERHEVTVVRSKRTRFTAWAHSSRSLEALTKTALERGARSALAQIERAVARRMLDGTPAL